MKTLIIALLAVIPIVSFAESPSWVKETQRTIKGSDILHWGQGEATTSDIAIFKARHMAIRAILEECGGYASSSITTRKTHVESSPSGYTAFAKVSIDYSDCYMGLNLNEHRRKNLPPENAVVVKGQKLYDKLLFAKLTEDPQKEKVLSDEEVEKKIRNLIEEESNVTQDRISHLEEKIRTIEHNAKAPPIIVQPVKIPSKTSQRVICEQEYAMLAQELMMESAEYNNNTSATPELMMLSNRVDAKARLCNRMK